MAASPPTMPFMLSRKLTAFMSATSASNIKNHVNLERSFKLMGVFFPVDRYDELRDFFSKVQAGDDLQTVLHQDSTAAAQPN